MNVQTDSFHLPSLAELLRRRRPVRDVNAEHDQSLSRMDHIAVFITERVGTMGFFFLIFVWTTLWLSWNFLAPKRLQFDPPMAFVFWLFISNMIQIFLMPLIMIGQNLEARHSELRAQSDYEINVKAEREVAAVLQNLEYQTALLIALVEKVGVDLASVQATLTTHTDTASSPP